MLTALSRDWIVRITVLVWLAVLSMYLVPGVSRVALETFSTRYLVIVTLIPVIAATWIGVSRLPDVAERRFWITLGVGFSCWLAANLPVAWVADEEWSRLFDVLVDGGYLLYYIIFILAIESRPHEEHDASLSEKEQRLRTTGLAVIGFFMLLYFVLLPAAFSMDAYDTTMPSFYMFVLLDLVILGRLLWMRRETWSVRWSTIYAWLAVGALLATAGDVVEALSNVDEVLGVPEIVSITPGSLLDHLWMLPGIVFVLAIRARHVSFPPEQRVLNEPAPRRPIMRAGHILVVGALALPFLHYALYATGLVTGVEYRALREAISMAGMVALGALAIAAYRTLELERDGMETTELRLVRELSVARKMDAVARLAGSVAHDFNNLVQVIRGRAEIIGHQIDADNPLHDDVRQIRSAATRAADLASQLMTFGRRQQAHLTAVSLRQVLKRAERLLKPLLDERTRLVLTLNATADVVRIDPTQFERIVLNLATNARDAMPDGGTLTIETSTPPASANIDVAPRVVLRISDTGTGMDAETINHIFEPFFSTKHGRGAGLGLATVHSLVQQFEGTIGVESRPGQGTAFTITLPVISEVPVPQGALAEAPDTEETPSAVLIVEGDTTNRQLLRRLLSDIGRPVLATATAAEASLIASRYSGPIALAVVDVTIEGGRTLGRRLRESREDLRVLMLAQDQPVELGEGDQLLREPFDSTDVVRAATALLDTNA